MARKRVVTVTVEVPRKAPRLHLAAGGRDGAAGSITSPVCTWTEIVRRLVQLHDKGSRAAVVRVLGENYPALDSESRRQLRELEEDGMRLDFQTHVFQKERSTNG